MSEYKQDEAYYLLKLSLQSKCSINCIREPVGDKKKICIASLPGEPIPCSNAIQSTYRFYQPINPGTSFRNAHSDAEKTVGKRDGYLKTLPLNMYELWFHENFRIEPTCFDEKNIEGVLSFENRTIYIHQYLSPERIRFVLAKFYRDQAIGWNDKFKKNLNKTLTIHYKSVDDSTLTNEEIVENIFATSLLIPNKSFFDATKEFDFYKTSIIGEKKFNFDEHYVKWGVPADVLAYRFSINFYLVESMWV